MNKLLLLLPKWVRDALGIKITVAKITSPLSGMVENLELLAEQHRSTAIKSRVRAEQLHAHAGANDNAADLTYATATQLREQFKFLPRR